MAKFGVVNLISGLFVAYLSCLEAKMQVFRWFVVVSAFLAVKCEERCEIDACEALNRSKMDLQEFSDSVYDKVNSSYVRRLEQRIRSFEQPVFNVISTQFKWEDCRTKSRYCRCLEQQSKLILCEGSNLTIIPRDLLIPDDTIIIDFDSNQLTTFHKDTFQQNADFTRSLWKLSAAFNKIDYLPRTIFDNLIALQDINFENNLIEDLHEDTFIDVYNLWIINLSDNLLTTLPARLFRNNAELKYVHFARNKLKILPEIIFKDLRAVIELDLSKNEFERLPQFIFKDLHELQLLDLSHNKLNELAANLFDFLVNLKTLNLNKNKLSVIKPGLFDKLEFVYRLTLSSCELVSIKATDFIGLKELEVLHLGNNLIEKIEEDSFIYNGKLDRIFLSANNLEALPPNAFRGLHNLKTLDLSNNMLSNLDSKTFLPLSNLTSLILSSNFLHYLPVLCLETMPVLSEIQLGKNPWHCDCNILYLATWLEIHFDNVWDGAPLCRGPAELGGKQIQELGFDDLCAGQWASMVNLSARVPVRQPANQTLENKSGEENTTLNTPP